MSNYEHLQPEDMFDYLLERLTPQEMADAREHIESCAACAEERDHVEAALGELVAAEPLVELPLGARERMLGVLSDRPPLASSLPPVMVAEDAGFVAQSQGNDEGLGDVRPVPHKPGRRPAAFAWIGWAAAAAMLLVLAGVERGRTVLQRSLDDSYQREAALTAREEHTNAILQSLTGPGVVHASLTEPKAPTKPAARLVYAPKTGALLLVASDLQPLEPGKVYELWLIPAGASAAPVPEGTFRPDAHGAASMLQAEGPKGLEPKAFGITVEAAGGAQKPTLPIVLAGAPG